MAKIYTSAEQLIGGTPLLELKKYRNSLDSRQNCWLSLNF